jgi:5-methylcytosine-specific restriction protein B
MLESKRVEFVDLFREFASSYPSTSDGMHHIKAYEEQRTQGRENFEAIVEAADRKEDMADQVLLKLLPYSNSPAYENKGAWIHIAPAPGDHRARIKSMRPEDWSQAALAILRFVRRCNGDPSRLAQACEEFTQSPYSSGFQTGMLTPILNTLRPDNFLIINSKPRQTINYFADKSYGSSLAEYPALNAAGQELIAEVAEQMAGEMHQAGVPDMRDTDRFDMFSHWLVAVKKFKFPNTRYWKIAPGENAWQWDEWRENNPCQKRWSHKDHSPLEGKPC